MKFKLSLISLIVSGIFIISSLSVNAVSKSVKVNIPQVNGAIRSDIWQCNADQWHNQDWQVTAYYHGSTPYNANWIKSAWTFKAFGAGVSIGGGSGTTGNSSFSGSWKNYNHYISTASGSYYISGLALTGNGSNTASLLVSGLVRQATSSIWRAY